MLETYIHLIFCMVFDSFKKDREWFLKKNINIYSFVFNKAWFIYFFFFCFVNRTFHFDKCWWFCLSFTLLQTGAEILGSVDAQWFSPRPKSGFSRFIQRIRRIQVIGWYFGYNEFSAFDKWTKTFILLTFILTNWKVWIQGR